MRNMFDNSALTVYQGNAMLIEITLTDSETGEPVGVANTDYVLFTVVDMNERVVIQKKLTSEDYDSERQVVQCKLEPEDTTQLLTGDYYYDCLYVYDNETPTTVISSQLVIKKAFGKYENGGESID